MYLGFLPSQLAMREFEWLILFGLNWHNITMTRNDLSIIWISLVFWEVHKNTHAYSIKNVLLFFACFYVTSCQALKKVLWLLQCYPKIIALIKKSVKGCLIKSQLNIKCKIGHKKLNLSTHFLPEIHWVTAGQLCVNISELCLEILHTYASDSWIPWITL